MNWYLRKETERRQKSVHSYCLWAAIAQRCLCELSVGCRVTLAGEDRAGGEECERRSWREDPGEAADGATGGGRSPRCDAAAPGSVFSYPSSVARSFFLSLTSAYYFQVRASRISWRLVTPKTNTSGTSLTRRGPKWKSSTCKKKVSILLPLNAQSLYNFLFVNMLNDVFLESRFSHCRCDWLHVSAT